MNFADILDKWDKQKGGEYIKEEENADDDRFNERRRLLRKKPDAVIDLHGLNQDEAWTALENFFSESQSMGFEKVLIVHGKGNHSKNDAVLKEITRKFIEHCPFAGASDRSSGSAGGSGATWVLLKLQRSR